MIAFPFMLFSSLFRRFGAYRHPQRALKSVVPVALLATLLVFQTGCTTGSNSLLSLVSDVDYTVRQVVMQLTGQSRSEAVSQNPGIALYHDVWQTVQEEFIDTTYNGQQWASWEHRYDSHIQTVEDAFPAIQTMLVSLGDDYTRFLLPREMKEQAMQISAKLCGVGIQIMDRQNKLFVVSVLKDTPSAKTGILPGDQIVAIDNHPTAGLDVRDAADLIRGPEGTTVRLTLSRDKKPVAFNTLLQDDFSRDPKAAIPSVQLDKLGRYSIVLKRAAIHIDSVTTKDLPNNIGYIRLASFISDDGGMEMVEAVSKMKDKKGLILDLRGNVGGLFTNAVLVSDLFLANGTIVSIEGRGGQEESRMSALPGNEVTMPLVVLIDRGSASASEIVSGALKDHGRATLVGTRTFGKGLVQKVNPMREGAGLNLTVSRYLTPKGTDINHTGVAPDVKVALPMKDFLANRDPQLQAGIRVLEKALVKR